MVHGRDRVGTCFCTLLILCLVTFKFCCQGGESKIAMIYQCTVSFFLAIVFCDPTISAEFNKKKIGLKASIRGEEQGIVC